MSVRGVLHVHCAPPALCPHVEWAVAGVLGVPVNLSWADQPASPGSVRAELQWHGAPGTSAAITSALAGWDMLRFEVTEEASPGCDAVRYSCTPSLGTFCAVVGANGDIMVQEGRLRAALSLAAASKRAADGPGGRSGRETDVATPRKRDGDLATLHERDGDLATLRERDGDLATLRERHGPRHPALGGSLEAEIALLLGQPWDDELEPFRRAGDGAPVRWLNATG